MMTAAETVEALTALIERHGDWPLQDVNGNPIDYIVPEFDQQKYTVTFE